MSTTVKPFNRRDFAGKYSDNQLKYISVGWNAAMYAMAAEQELLRECHLSGQMSAAQSVAHFGAAPAVPHVNVHDYPACAVFRGGRCTCDAQDS
jgi:hypothetical protein